MFTLRAERLNNSTKSCWYEGGGLVAVLPPPPYTWLITTPGAPQIPVEQVVPTPKKLPFAQFSSVSCEQIDPARFPWQHAPIGCGHGLLGLVHEMPTPRK